MRRHVAVCLDQLLRLVEEKLRIRVHILEELVETAFKTDCLHDTAHFTMDALDFA